MSTPPLPPDDVKLPSYRRMLWDALRALQQLGGSGHKSEITPLALSLGSLDEAQQAKMMPNGRLTEAEYKLNWCYTALKAVGYMSNSGGGVWALTEAGTRLTEADMDDVRREIARYYRAARRRNRDEAEEQAPEDDVAETDVAEADAWKDDLLARMKAMDPAAFERLCQRLLREAGFEKVEVTGRSGDGGIDGVGLLRIGLVSFPTYFQCKRYADSVGAGAVRDFRGAMAGRGEKGVIISTATFTPAARQEATRDGVPPIDLVDGNELCDLLRKHRVGVTVTPRTVEDVAVDIAWWGEQAGG
jgi:restriction system protein